VIFLIEEVPRLATNPVPIPEPLSELLASTCEHRIGTIPTHELDPDPNEPDPVA
jgi:hypothetical protein